MERAILSVSFFGGLARNHKCFCLKIRRPLIFCGVFLVGNLWDLGYALNLLRLPQLFLFKQKCGPEI